MAISKIQFQKGLSFEQFMKDYGTESQVATDQVVSGDLPDDAIEDQYCRAGAEAPPRHYMESRLEAQAQVDGSHAPT